MARTATTLATKIDPAESNQSDSIQAPKGFTILHAMTDPKLFGAWFQPVQSWRAWMTFLAAVFGIEITSLKGRERFKQFTGREKQPPAPVKEAWMVCGRRAGKSRVSGLIAVYL